MSLRHWVLDGTAVRESTLREWATQFETPGARVVAQSTVGEARISTVFLGIDHQFGDGPPLLFETMVFGGPHSETEWRYSTWEEAKAGHARVVDALSRGQDPEAA